MSNMLPFLLSSQRRKEQKQKEKEKTAVSKGRKSFDSARPSTGPVAPTKVPEVQVQTQTTPGEDFLDAAEAGDLGTVEALIHKTNKAVVRFTDDGGDTALHCAAEMGHHAVCETLLKSGADPNALNSYLLSPLHCATIGGKEDIVLLLLEHGADDQLKDRTGRTPLDMAKIRKHAKCTELLEARRKMVHGGPLAIPPAKKAMTPTLTKSMGNSPPAVSHIGERKGSVGELKDKTVDILRAELRKKTEVLEQKDRDLMEKEKVITKKDLSIQELEKLLQQNEMLMREETIKNQNIIKAKDGEIQRVKKEMEEIQAIHRKRAVESSSASVDQALDDSWIDTISINYLTVSEEQKIFDGSFTVLYKGRWRDQDIGVKKLKLQELSADTHYTFVQEMQVYTRLRHPSIANILGACMKPPNISVILQNFPRGSLYDVLHVNKIQFEFPMIVRIATEIASGMGYLHRSKIWHRDLKSQNVLVDADWSVKLSDFGLHRTKEEIKSKINVPGTQWTAPEIFAEKPFTEKSDVYSFGMVLYELVTNKIPFADVKQAIQIALQVVTEKKRPPIPNECDSQLKQMIQESWADQPKERPTFSHILSHLDKRMAELELYHKRTLLYIPKEEFKLVQGQTQNYLTIDLKRPENELSRAWRSVEFAIVENAFHRFVNRKDLYTVTKVQVLINPTLEKTFLSTQKDFIGGMEGDNPALVWYVPFKEDVEEISSKGFSSVLSKLADSTPKKYGAGVYFSKFPNYGQFFMDRYLPKSSSGGFVLLYCWVLLGKTFNVSEKMEGNRCEEGYDSHQVLVDKQGKLVDPTQKICGTEVIIFQDKQILPRYLVHVKMNK